jgi:hypothetical protein
VIEMAGISYGPVEQWLAFAVNDAVNNVSSCNQPASSCNCNINCDQYLGTRFYIQDALQTAENVSPCDATCVQCKNALNVVLSTLADTTRSSCSKVQYLGVALPQLMFYCQGVGV